MKLSEITNIEKLVIVILVLSCTWFSLSVRACNNEIEKLGGGKQAIISIGKEIKDISKKIKED